MKYPLLYVVLAGLALQTIPSPIYAFVITPGKWQFEYEGRASFQPQAQKRTDIECVTDSNWDPTTAIAKSGHCQLQDIREDKHSFSGTVSCSRGAGNPPMTGTMRYTSTGTTLTGRTAFTGQDYDMEMRTSGTRLGECD